MRTRFLVTGAQGMLGAEFCKILKDHPSYITMGLSRDAMDVTNKEHTLKVIKSFNPDYIIHCAALVDADKCQANKEMSFKSIVYGTENVLEAAEKTGSTIIYPQSFLIYGQNYQSVDEETIPAPLSVYGEHKLIAEQLVLSHSSKSLIIRMGGFFGGHIRDKNFVGKLLRHIYSHMTPFQSELLIGDRIWQPSYTLDLALNTLHLIDNNASGVWCMASQGYTDFYSLAKECISLLGVDKYFYVRRVSSSEVEDRELAKRPKKLVMSTRKLEAAGLSLLRNWEDSLRSYIVNEWLCDFEKHPLFSNMTEQKAA